MSDGGPVGGPDFDFGGPALGPPKSQVTDSTLGARPVDIDPDLTSLIDRLQSETIENPEGNPVRALILRVATAKPNEQNPTEMAEARRWLHGYMRKFSREHHNPPDDKILAQFLAVAEWPRLERLIYDLMAERQEPGHSYAWFIAVAMQRIHGIQPEALREGRKELKLLRKKRGEDPDQRYAKELLEQLTEANWPSTRKASGGAS